MSLPRLEECRDSFDIVTCVPMKRSKRIKRGFNQSELVARDLSRQLGKSFRRLLREKGTARAQRDLSYRERFINILDRYGVRDPGKIMGRRILLVDDVFTTGATVNECARILRNAGAKEVYSLTFARAGIKKASGRLHEPVSPVESGGII
jgi:ComF family protein